MRLAALHELPWNMAEPAKENSVEQLTLESRIAELAKVSNWTQSLASRHAIPENVHFGIDLCLEEVIANVISHGYGGSGDHTLAIMFERPMDGRFVFVVEDNAPPFNPLEAPELPPLDPDGEIRVGGQGIRLLRRFADTLDYEACQHGNRLRIGFFSSGAKQLSK